MARESRYALRLPSELHEQIRAEAERTGVSMNEFIVRVLSEYFAPKDQLEQRVAKVESTLLVAKAVLERAFDFAVDDFVVTIGDDGELTEADLHDAISRRVGRLRRRELSDDEKPA